METGTGENRSMPATALGVVRALAARAWFSFAETFRPFAPQWFRNSPCNSIHYFSDITTELDLIFQKFGHMIEKNLVHARLSLTELVCLGEQVDASEHLFLHVVLEVLLNMS